MPSLNSILGNSDLLRRSSGGTLEGVTAAELAAEGVYAVPIARHSFNPAVLETKSTTSNTPVDADAGDMVVTFTVPDNGCVCVILSAVGDGGGTGGNGMEWWLREGAADVAGSGMIATRVASAESGRFTTRHFISGLTPAASVTWKWGIATISGSGGTSRILVGGEYGPAIMEVWTDPLG